MKQKISHPWDLTPSEAKTLQEKLSKKVFIPPSTQTIDFTKIKTIAACDVSFKDNKLIAVVVVLSHPDFKILMTYKIIESITKLFPYIPGFLSFREGPSLVKLLKKIHNPVDLTLFDGQGIAHPRKFGIASHIGVLFDIPTIGCAKNLLYGDFSTLAERKGSKSYIKTENNEIIGTAVRTRSFVKPVFVSPGHKISIDDAAEFILECADKFRIPEPLRIAHNFSKSTF